MKKKHDQEIKIKICGMRDPANIKKVLKLKPDYIGFILYPGSTRYLGDDYPLEVDIPQNTKRVGVFVNALMDKVIYWVNRLQLDLAQLHGQEGPEYCREIKQMGIKVIKAFGISNSFNFDELKKYAPWCDYFLFDTKTEIHGGSGQKFDWTLLDNYKLDVPVFLSGGIEISDIPILKSIDKSWLHAVDINSKFEISPAMKDVQLLQDFFNQFRSE